MLPSQRHESDGKSECTDAQHQVLARCLREDARAAIHCPFSLPRSKHGRAAIYCSCAPSRCKQRRTAAERQSFCSSKFATGRRAQRCYLRKCIAPRSGIVLEKSITSWHIQCALDECARSGLVAQKQSKAAASQQCTFDSCTGFVYQDADSQNWKRHQGGHFKLRHA